MAKSQAREVKEPTGPSDPVANPASPESQQTDVIAKVPDFAELSPGGGGAGANPMDFLLDVNVTVSAELGRTTLLLGDVLKLGVGSVLQLDRPVADPVDLMVQGRRLARGEVVVVDDRFAIRIQEIADPKKRP
jgi:flagellar motor switch protein FliN/FliY